MGRIVFVHIAFWGFWIALFWQPLTEPFSKHRENKPKCEQMVETLKQTIQVKEMSNKLLREMVRKRDSIIYIQDSTIVALKNHIH